MNARLREGLRARLLRLGLETHITLPLFTVALLAAIWFVTFHFIDGERAAVRAATIDSVRELADTYEAQMARSLGGIDQMLKVIKYAAERKGARGALQELDSHGLLPSGLVFAVALTDAQGNVVASNPQVPAISVADEEYFRVHVLRNVESVAVSRTMRDAAKNEWHIHFTRRLNDEQGRFAGIAIVEVDPAYFTSSYERARQGDKGMLGLVGGDGELRVLRVGEALTWGRHLPASALRGAMPAASPTDGVRRYIEARPLHGFGLNAVVGLAEDEQLAAFEQHRRDSLLKAGAGSVAAVTVAGLFWLWIWQGAKTRRRIRRAQETYAAASQGNLDAFFVLHSVRAANGEIVDFTVADANTQAEKMVARPRADLVQRRVCDLLPDCRASGVFASLVRMTQQGGVHEAEWQNRIPQLRAGWLHQQIVGVEDGIVVILRDITERKHAEARILHLAHHDALTGLPNRTMLMQELEREIACAQGRTLLAAFIDLDSFKLVNDGLGHHAGDELLCAVAARMERCMRPGDTVGRFGGDEFVLVLPGLDAGQPEAVALLETVRLAVTEPLALGGQEVQVSCSIGVAAWPRHARDAGALLSHADNAMYRAKELGKNNCQFYTEAMDAKNQEKLALLEGLRNALDDGQFRVLYQPKIDARSGRVFGAEALVRWIHPQQGMISPVRFIPLAEESGLIVAIGEWVLRAACAQARAWEQAGLPLTVSVNVSARQFDDPRLVSRVAQALADTGLPPALLELEVTESLIMRDMQQAVEKMAELEAMGVALSVDDFGTGYSSLSALKSFPISRLKIDKSFVSDLEASADDQAIARAIISLAHQLHLRVVAEGVETAQQRRFLSEFGCDEMQGFLFSKPVPADEIAPFALRAEESAVAA